MTTFYGHMERSAMNISAAAFKAECLKLMDQVEKTGKPVIITKHGRPVAQLVPIPPRDKSLFGYMKNTVRIKGEIISPVDESWSALAGDEENLYRGASAKPRPRSHK
jgi:prevent-host-death family protein